MRLDVSSESLDKCSAFFEIYALEFTARDKFSYRAIINADILHFSSPKFDCTRGSVAQIA